MKYNVKITETLAKSITIEAENAEEAQRKVEENYRFACDDYVLGAEDFQSVDFEVVDETL